MTILSSPGQYHAEHPTCITIGNFDGLHLGHLSLLKKGAQIAREQGLDFLAVTFWPHTREIIGTGFSGQRLSTREEKLTQLLEAGAKAILEIPFSQKIAALSPEDFIKDWLLPLHPAHIVIGHDFHFGRERQGALATLSSAGTKAGFALTQAPACEQDGKAISSSRLREEILKGDMEAAAALAGRPYAIEGAVQRGFGRGGNLGFPTANLAPPDKLLPPEGVYATRVVYKNNAYPAVTNIGRNPTFNGEKLTIESFLPGTRLNLYGESIRIEFLKRLRGEKKFANAEELKIQIATDIDNAGKIFAALS